MDKMALPIMVVKREILFEEIVFEGFLAHHDYNFEGRILEHFEFLERGIAEQTPAFQQPIPYAIITDTSGNIFAYQRSSKKEYAAETRLYGKWSCGVGGHVDKQDISENPLSTSLMREIEEELGLSNFETIEPLGYINDESTPVSRVHFGILYRVTIKNVQNIQLSQEMATGGFYAPEELSKHLRSQPETERWTIIALNALGIA